MVTYLFPLQNNNIHTQKHKNAGDLIDYYSSFLCMKLISEINLFVMKKQLITVVTSGSCCWNCHIWTIVWILFWMENLIGWGTGWGGNPGVGNPGVDVCNPTPEILVSQDESPGLLLWQWKQPSLSCHSVQRSNYNVLISKPCHICIQ